MKKLLTLLLWLIPLTCFHTQAGSRNQTDNPQHSPELLASFSKLVEKTAASHGARAFFIARKGRAPADMPKGVLYSHTALAVYSLITTPDHQQVPGYVIYNLYQNNDTSGKSTIVADFPVDFFAAAHTLAAAISIPTRQLQLQLLQLIQSGAHKALHNPNYSLISNPFNSKYQNCTEYSLDILNAAIYQTTNIKQLKANARAYFVPQQLGKSLKLKLAASFTDFVHLDDHPQTIETTTYTTITQYLKDNELLQKQLSLDLSDLRSR